MNLLRVFIKFISQWKIIVPGIAILMVILLLPPQQRGLTQQQKSIVVSPVQLQPPKMSSNSSTLKTIDFEGSYSCEEASISAKIKNKKIFITQEDAKKTHVYLFVGDCLYVWDKDTFSGLKYCGVGRYIDIAASLSKSGLLSTNDLLSSFFSLSKIEINDQQKQVKDLFNSCRSDVFIGEDIFNIPKNVLFKNKSLK